MNEDLQYIHRFLKKLKNRARVINTSRGFMWLCTGILTALSLFAILFAIGVPQKLMRTMPALIAILGVIGSISVAFGS